MHALSVFFGVLVGLSLGLTGGGGTLLAVPMLVYGLAVPAADAVGISLASVGMTSLLGVIQRLRRGHVEVATGLMFAAAGMVGAPLGTQISLLLPETVLLVLFSGIMLGVAAFMWRRSEPDLPGPAAEPTDVLAGESKPVCDGNGQITTRCRVILLLTGVLTGVLSGTFGVGGGFVIVPAMVTFGGMSMHRAVGTSLLIIVLVSLSGVTSFLLRGRTLDWQLTALFLIGGALGLTLSTLLVTRISGPRLRRIFAIGIVFIALFVVARTLMG
ncbi:MAG: sulfite exporter TauE/SafE family protein [Planctomycetaceae bacterium]